MSNPPLPLLDFWAYVDVTCPRASHYTFAQEKAIYDDLLERFNHERFEIKSETISRTYKAYPNMDTLLEDFELSKVLVLEHHPNGKVKVTNDVLTKAKLILNIHHFDLLGPLDDGTYLVKGIPQVPKELRFP